MKYDRKSDFKSRFRFGKSLFSGKNEKKVIFLREISFSFVYIVEINLEKCINLKNNNMKHNKNSDFKSRSRPDHSLSSGRMKKNFCGNCVFRSSFN